MCSTTQNPSKKKLSNLKEEIYRAVQAIKTRKMVIMTDDEDRENEGDLVIAAQFATPQAINFMTRQACGLICLSLSPNQIDRLKLPPMTLENKSQHETPFTVSIEAASGVTTGISAFDRSHTIRVAASPDAKPEEIVSPGHIFPLRAHPKGVLGRNGHTEGALDLVKLAGLGEGAVICEIMAKDGTMMRGAELKEYAQRHHFPMISIKNLITWISEHGTQALENFESEQEEIPSSCICTASAEMPDLYAGSDLKIHVFRFPNSLNPNKEIEQIALVKGDLSEGTPLVRLHSACLTGDALGSLRCDCGPQLQEALRRIKAAPSGALIYLRDHEGRGIGLEAKIKAYALQDKGLDTVAANEALGYPADLRDFSQGIEILKTLGAKSVRLMTNNPRKIAALEKAGLKIESQERLELPTQEFNRFYLETKKKRLGHALELPKNASPSTLDIL
ncbi:3,4-dihydroxy-2-butanone-4-phosphate synthase [Acetobacteraceae bacterium]|nr:3,4-dihydroxy-2-butanone-4-phosphate synthase [Acetobacteraceae bacterium]QCE33792.1 3,4-dihydroxy-2-butanone-4-phosphate synthase [Acetobacteraceae bacterium]